MRSRPILRAAREVGAYYRAQLAHELRTRGYAIEAETGKRGRYFELVGVGEQAREAFSHRSRQVATAAERFRASHGRAPERGELRALKLQSRAAKAPATRPELDREPSHRRRDDALIAEQLLALATWRDQLDVGVHDDPRMELAFASALLAFARQLDGRRARVRAARHQRSDG